MTNREKARAEMKHTTSHRRNAVDTLGRCNLNKRGGAGKRNQPKAQASPQSLAFRAYVESGVEPAEARRLAGLPALR
jgi:hypothetical protein